MSKVELYVQEFGAKQVGSGTQDPYPNPLSKQMKTRTPNECGSTRAQPHVGVAKPLARPTRAVVEL